jgi:hypothetical protein
LAGFIPARQRAQRSGERRDVSPVPLQRHAFTAPGRHDPLKVAGNQAPCRGERAGQERECPQVVGIEASDRAEDPIGSDVRIGRGESNQRRTQDAAHGGHGDGQREVELGSRYQAPMPVAERGQEAGGCGEVAVQLHRRIRRGESLIRHAIREHPKDVQQGECEGVRGRDAAWRWHGLAAIQASGVDVGDGAVAPGHHHLKVADGAAAPHVVETPTRGREERHRSTEVAIRLADRAGVAAQVVEIEHIADVVPARRREVLPRLNPRDAVVQPLAPRQRDVPGRVETALRDDLDGQPAHPRESNLLVLRQQPEAVGARREGAGQGWHVELSNHRFIGSMRSTTGRDAP